MNTGGGGGRGRGGKVRKTCCTVLPKNILKHENMGPRFSLKPQVSPTKNLPKTPSSFGNPTTVNLWSNFRLYPNIMVLSGTNFDISCSKIVLFDDSRYSYPYISILTYLND
jgi:hypothetical protein